jgi:hypothetical protein
LNGMRLLIEPRKKLKARIGDQLNEIEIA